MFAEHNRNMSHSSKRNRHVRRVINIRMDNFWTTKILPCNVRCLACSIKLSYPR